MEATKAKNIIKSKTVWGIIMMVVGYMGSKAGITVADADVQLLVDVGFDIFTGISALYAMYGRVVATHRLDS